MCLTLYFQSNQNDFWGQNYKYSLWNNSFAEFWKQRRSYKKGKISLTIWIFLILNYNLCTELPRQFHHKIAFIMSEHSGPRKNEIVEAKKRQVFCRRSTNFYYTDKIKIDLLKITWHPFIQMKYMKLWNCNIWYKIWSILQITYFG